MIKKTLFFETDIKKDGLLKIEKAYNKMLEEMNTGVTGYYDLPINQENVIEDIYDFIATNEYLEHNLIKDLVVIGIGGSSLGTRAIDTLLKFSHNRNIINIHFLENLDPLYLINSIKNIDLSKAFIVIISKSGTTIETISIAKYIFSLLKDPLKGLDINQKIAIITDKDSPLDKLSNERGWKVFHIPKNVGGRFSVLSPVGLFPLAVLGYDIEELLKGANIMREEFLHHGPNLLMFKKAYFYYKNANEKNINILFSYSSMFEAFNKWYIQLWGESLGKKTKSKKRVGLTPIGLIGSIDQHSFLQLIIEGPKDKTVTFLKLKNFELPVTVPHISLPYLETTDFANGRRFQTIINTQCDATIESVIEADVPVDLIEINELNESSVGYLIYYFELLTSAVGAMFNINVYNQPGVESGKQKLKIKLSK
ncbi:glucose-6-phosphate isomerase [Nitrosophilus kaiyonis]|uniref:glucose-6-phosphate isomerase n=1 Tax=Nitrosophilus kaiyonis TaxID=2930200 RepID=UPI002490FC73|nr:glucose-6-phosphate isomerase [Nitrosophilus kaiyonis]